MADALIRLLRDRRVCVLTGAGISTESGIPDYRGPMAPPRKRPPLQHRDFLTDPSTRARYWARSLLGWPRFRDFAPNAAHDALARWNAVTGVITQNVDRLHHKAGQSNVLELHGALADVTCLTCTAHMHRDELQLLLERNNPHALDWKHTLLADGDAELPDSVVDGFHVPSCLQCGGVLKPDVVFFGDSVPPARLDVAWRHLEEAEALFVIGTSLTVFSGYRFVLRAKERRLPIAVMNVGPTRADADATVKVEAWAAQELPRVVAQLSSGSSSSSRS
ncbi:MAG: NAD-dependent protein deacetylase [Archangium gephyra]|uniref:protein acetyllysine N-acetyltransferase n=1 Tax=Archangium gephyra TaxID=48 RepID=A0A2W5U8W3_9BACT|nr:MAG: NAD-dependent protein deacetylase [Archangium gephyra]